MKQLLQSMRSGKMVIAEVPIPSPRPGMVVVQTAVSLVSAGTERMLVEFASKNLLEKARSRPDLAAQVIEKARREGALSAIEAAFSRLDQPVALGYSSAGSIIGIGAGVQGFQVGDRVACGGGGYAVHAEYAIVPKNLLAHLPDSVSFEAAAFATLGSVAMHAFRLSQSQLGDRVGIIGLGLLGLISVGIAQAAGCEVFGVDLDPGRVKLASSLGASAVLRNVAEDAYFAFSHGRGLDTILICADAKTNDPVELAGSMARDRARVIAVGAVGLDIPRKLYYEKELDFMVSRSYGPGRYDPVYEEQGKDYPIGYVRWTEGRNMDAFIQLLASNRIDVKPLISHRFPIDDAPQAYELITNRSEPSLGVLLTYPEHSQTDNIPPSQVINPASLSSINNKGEIKLGVLGAGNYASSVFLPMVQQSGGIIPLGIASASGLSAGHASHRFGFQYSSSAEEQVLNDHDISAVAILTRHQDHARQVIAAIKAGKHVYCEKPLAINHAQLDEIEALLATSPATLLAVGFNRRFAPLALQLKAFIAQRHEPLFASYRVNAGYLPLTHWLHDPQQGGGRIIGEACHFIDFLTFLVGALPVSVAARALPDGGRYCQDNVLLTFIYPDGSIGTVNYLANGDKSFSKERLEVLSGGRVAILDDFRSLELVHNGRRRVIKSHLRQDKGHRASWETFLAAIKTGGPVPIPYNELLGITRASFKAVEALSGNQVDSSPSKIDKVHPGL